MPVVLLVGVHGISGGPPPAVSQTLSGMALPLSGPSSHRRVSRLGHRLGAEQSAGRGDRGHSFAGRSWPGFQSPTGAHVVDRGVAFRGMVFWEELEYGNHFVRKFECSKWE